MPYVKTHDEPTFFGILGFVLGVFAVILAIPAGFRFLWKFLAWNLAQGLIANGSISGTMGWTVAFVLYGVFLVWFLLSIYLGWRFRRK